MAGKTYRELIAWQKAVDFVVAVYEAAKAFPREELYGLTAQLKRAVVSVPCNIAEGSGRRTIKDFVHFLSIAYGSLREVETQLEIASRLGFIPADRLRSLLERAGEVGRLINGLSKSLSEGHDG
jgi:four helix bundle protein